MGREIIIGRDEDDRETYGTDAAIFLGKHYVKMGQNTSLSNEIYMDMNRSHVAFVCGKRGSGKCLTGDTLVTLDNGEVVPIKELENREDDVLALDSDMKIKNSDWDDFQKRTVNKLLKIKTKTGKELKLTPNHPLLTLDGWKQAGTLEEGSRVATPRKEASFGTEARPYHEVKLMAYLLAEGHLSNKKVLFTNKDPLILEDFIHSVKKFAPWVDLKKHGRPGCLSITGRETFSELTKERRDKQGRFTSENKTDNRSYTRRWLDSMGMYNSLAKERKMPKQVFKLPKYQLTMFLNRLFSCDGSLHKNVGRNWQVSYSSASKEFIQSVSHLLLKYGIVSKVREKYSKEYDSTSYEIIISGKFAEKYLQEIGFFGAKEEKAKKAMKEMEDIKRNPNNDTIPKEIWDHYQPENWAEIGREMGYKHPKSLRESQRYAPSRQKLLQIAKADCNEKLATIATSDVYWDEIKEVKELYGEFTVYDIGVPEKHNFIANDVIVHNSYTMGVMAEGMANMPKETRENISVILLDTMGVYWSMKYPNKQDKDLLKEWGMDPEGLDVKIYTPKGYYEEAKEEGIPTDKPFSVRISELDAKDWQTLMEVEDTSAIGVLIERVVNELQDEKDKYSIDDILEKIEENEDLDQVTREAAKNRFQAVKNWGVFDEEGTPLSELAQGGQVTVLDLSAYATMPGSWNIKSLVVGLVSEKLFVQRMASRKEEEFQSVSQQVQYHDEGEEKQDFPLVWLVIDEAHEFLPNDEKTLATDPLVTVLREGRQPGISLVLASQQPGKIHTDVMTQSDIILSHRITAKIDIEALGMLMQSYMRSGLDQYIDNLPRQKGAAIILDDNNEKIYPMRVRPRITWHGGSAPHALPEKDENELL